MNNPIKETSAANERNTITEEMLESMYLVGTYGGEWYGGNVELFSRTIGGVAEAVYVYADAPAQGREAAKKYAEEHGIPLICQGDDLDEEEKQAMMVEARCQATMYGHMCEGPCSCHSVLTEKYYQGFLKNPESFREIVKANAEWRAKVDGLSTAKKEVCADCGAPEDESIRFGGFDRPLCLACRTIEGARIEKMAEDDIEESMAEEVRILDEECTQEEDLGTCSHCHAEGVEVEEDLDTILCAPCRRALYTQGPASQKLKEGSQ